MGYRAKNRYDAYNYPSSKLGDFLQGLCFGTIAFMSGIGWVIPHLLQWIGVSEAWGVLSMIGVSLSFGFVIGMSMLKDDSN